SIPKVRQSRRPYSPAPAALSDTRATHRHRVLPKRYGYKLNAGAVSAPRGAAPDHTSQPAGHARETAMSQQHAQATRVTHDADGADGAAIIAVRGEQDLATSLTRGHALSHLVRQEHSVI